MEASLWRLKHTREKKASFFSHIDAAHGTVPEYIFCRPNLRLCLYQGKIFGIICRNQEKSKRSWEAEWWYVGRSNFTICQAEKSHTRQLLMGNKFVRNTTEKYYLWLPDGPNYSGHFPGLKSVLISLTTKISWNEFNRMPHDTF